MLCLLLLLEFKLCGNYRIILEKNTILHIKSPNYPDNYPHNSNCSWTIEAPPLHTVDVTFQDMNVEKCCDCLEVS